MYPVVVAVKRVMEEHSQAEEEDRVGTGLLRGPHAHDRACSRINTPSVSLQAELGPSPVSSLGVVPMVSQSNVTDQQSHLVVYAEIRA